MSGKGSSLLAAGISEVRGNFHRGELVSCEDGSGQEIARGLTNYGAADCRRVAGHSSEQFKELLGFAAEPELIHRDNLVLISR